MRILFPGRPRPFMPGRCERSIVIGLLVCFAGPAVYGQVLNPFTFGGPPGVYLDTDGKVQCRQIDAGAELAAMRARARAAQSAGKDPKLAYISIPKLFEQLRSLRAAKKEIPPEMRYLGGLTRIQYVLVFPEQKDLVIAGPAEPWKVVSEPADLVPYAIGTRTGRPVLQLDDLIVAMQTSEEGGGRLFGCGIYPSPDSLKIADDIETRMARNTRAERIKALADGLGPQEVRIFGTPNDTRLAFICVAADYELKRYAIGLDKSPVPGVGNGVDHSRSAANKYWFEASYEPLRVSKDGNAYEIRGQRLLVRAGGFDFDPRGATEKAMTFASQFTKNVPALAAAVPLYAELQNVADESFLANLLRRDRLAEKVGWDNSWIFDRTVCPVATVPVPRTAQTLVPYINGSIVAGGVMLTLDPWVGPQSRQTDESATPAREQLAKLRAASPSPGPILAPK
ncbi:MAG TPA: DUF1598 domain-containing protein [Tepidisphaeraceae bacterium]|nr:DUF1598 domain-containing protein [Tepidisphaeraceae bacterium]